MFGQKTKRRGDRRLLPILGPLGALLFTFAMVQMLIASSEGTATDFDQSTKAVAQTEAPPGAQLDYTIVISHTGSVGASGVQMTDTVPADLTILAPSLNVSPDIGTYAADEQMITWSGNLAADTAVTLTFSAVLTESISAGSYVTNTAEIAHQGDLITRTAETSVGQILYMPVSSKPIPSPVLSASRPSSSNNWTMSWTVDAADITKYELQEAQNPNFTNATITELTQTSQDVTKPVSFNNEYYYRVRAFKGSNVSDWSNMVLVAGNYRDDFNDPASNWEPVRRMTYLEETVARYGTGNEAGNLIIIVADRWDWMIASPLKAAPSVPYVIEYRTRVHDASNLVSGGPVFGGDWNGDACPEYGNVYQTDNCFNHFYNFNFIFYGPIKLLHEQVNQLVWCPNCGGSPIKRLGPTQTVDPVIGNGSSLDWHTYRIEVRADGARLFIDNDFKAHFTDTTWINEPYFGVFASTDEYKPSIWFFDYFSVTHLD